jgi:hypothetical protein
MENKTPVVITLVIMVSILLVAAGGLLVAYTGQSDKVQGLERQQREANEELEDANELIGLLEERVGEVQDDSRLRALPYRENTSDVVMMDEAYSTDLYSSVDGFLTDERCDPNRPDEEGNIFETFDAYSVSTLSDYLPAEITPRQIDRINSRLDSISVIGMCPFENRTILIARNAENITTDGVISRAPVHAFYLNEDNFLDMISTPSRNFDAEPVFGRLGDRILDLTAYGDAGNVFWEVRELKFDVQESEIIENCTVSAQISPDTGDLSDERTFTCAREFVGKN